MHDHSIKKLPLRVQKKQKTQIGGHVKNSMSSLILNLMLMANQARIVRNKALCRFSQELLQTVNVDSHDRKQKEISQCN